MCPYQFVSKKAWSLTYAACAPSILRETDGTLFTDFPTAGSSRNELIPSGIIAQGIAGRAGTSFICLASSQAQRRGS